VLSIGSLYVHGNFSNATPDSGLYVIDRIRIHFLVILTAAIAAIGVQLVKILVCAFNRIDTIVEDGAIVSYWALPQHR
jgi:hypothetical protein